MCKYLFLDVDGVLNHAQWYAELQRMPKDSRPGFPESQFDPNSVKHVHEILQNTGAKLVISSSWRLDTYLMHTFEKVGLPSEFEVTPYLPSYQKVTDEGADPYEYESYTHPCRGDEIKAFLDAHPCTNYCIIDDDTDMLPEQFEHFVKTNGETGSGLNKTCTKKAIEILNR